MRGGVADTSKGEKKKWLRSYRRMEKYEATTNFSATAGVACRGCSSACVRVCVSATCLCGGAGCRHSSWEPRRTPRSPRLFNYTLHDDSRSVGAYARIYRASFDKCGSASYRLAPMTYSEMYIAIKRTKNTCLFLSGGGELALIKSPQGDSPQSWHNGRVNDAA